jgi:ferrous iron transport protein B
MKKIALLGNPNSGKTAIFNTLTGSRQHVGNWPGVTVEKKQGTIQFDNLKYNVIDLPGIYSLTTNSLDEKISRDFLIEENPDLVLIVIDQTNFDRNFYLATEIIEMRKNSILIFNMHDEAEKLKIKVDVQELSKILNIPIILTSAKYKTGIDELKNQIEKSLKKPHIPNIIEYDFTFENYILEIEKVLNSENLFEKENVRWAAIKILEKDELHIKKLNKNSENSINEIIQKLEYDLKEDSSIKLSEEKYNLISKISSKYIKKPEYKERVSDKIDKIITHKILGIPIFIFIMWLMFTLTFTIGDVFNGYIEAGFENLGEYFSTVMPENLLSSFVIDGLIGGIGSVLVFVPNIFLLFIFISFLGDIGYMARAAFVMDKVMTKIGLHGKSFIPMLLGFGCNIPAIMGARTLESRKDRIITILVNPLMSCNARLPVYLIFAGIFFPNSGGTVVFSIYLFGIILSILMAFIFKKFLFKNEQSIFIMELPPYRLPLANETLGEALRKTLMFVKKAGTIIFASVIIIWFLASFPAGAEYASEESIIGHIGRFAAPFFKPLGFGFWQAAVSLIFGFLAKEVIVGTMGTLWGGEAALSEVLPAFFSQASAYAFMIFTLIYTPCVATIATIKNEIGKKWMFFTIIYLFVLAYIVSFIVYNILSFIW